MEKLSTEEMALLKRIAEGDRDDKGNRTTGMVCTELVRTKHPDLRRLRDLGLVEVGTTGLALWHQDQGIPQGKKAYLSPKGMVRAGLQGGS